LRTVPLAAKTLALGDHAVRPSESASMQSDLDPDGLTATLPAGAMFHPAVSGWLRARFGQATEVQARAWAVTSQRRHALIAAPTGSGKTLAAFLAAINELVLQGLKQGLADEIHVLYVAAEGTSVRTCRSRLPVSAPAWSRWGYPTRASATRFAQATRPPQSASARAARRRTFW